MEEMLGRRETESDEFRIPSLPFLTRAVKELHALHSEDYGLESHWNLKVILK